MEILDLKRLDRIVEDFIRKHKFDVDMLPMIVDCSKQIYMEKLLDNTDNKWSRTININESINIVYNFLKTIDLNMANQFYNILSSKDDNNGPYVNILPKKDYPNGHDEVRDGKVYIYFDNTPNDVFIILHEMLHKMNECNILNEKDENIDTIIRDYYGETVSILGELMLGKYMVEKGLITENDFGIRKNNRLNGSKENASDVIIENELINLKLKGKEINYENLITLLSCFDNGSMEYKILLDEKNDLRMINSILKNGSLSIDFTKRYVIAQVLSNRILNRDSYIDDFVKLFYAVGDNNSNINDVFNEIVNDKTI